MSTKTSSKVVAVFVVLLILVGAAAFYAGQNMLQPQPAFVTTVTQTVTGQATQQPSRVITIGGTLSLTGFYAPLTAAFPKLADAWADAINERGGIYVKELGQGLPVKFVVYDDKSDKATAVQLYERLITVDKADVLMAPYSADIGFAVAAVAERFGVPLVLAENDPTTGEQFNYKFVTSPIARFSIWSERYFDMIKNEGKARTIAFVGLDFPWAGDVFNGAVQMAQSVGLRVVFQQKVPVDAFDFTAIITAVKAQNPDIMYISTFAPHSVQFLKQSRELGLTPREFHVIEYGAEFVSALGDYSNLVTSEVYWVPSMNFGNSYLFREILQRAGITIDVWQWASLRMLGYDMIKEAIEQAGSLDKAKVNGALHGLNIMTIGGPLSIDANGVGNINTWPVQIQTGKIVAVWPSAVATGSHIYPRP